MTAVSSEPMSARDLRDWLTRAAPALAALGVNAHHGAAPRLVADGASWISFSSRAGSGRLVRAIDGSSESRAHRYSDGGNLIDSRATSTTEDQLETMMQALQ